MISIYKHKQQDMYAAWDDRSLIFPMEFHRHMEICQVLDGSLTLTTEDASYTLEKGDLYVIFPNVLHAVDMSHVRKRLWMFTPEIVSELSQVLLSRKPVCPVLRSDAANPLVNQLLDRCIRIHGRDGMRRRQFLMAHTTSLVHELLLAFELTAQGTNRGLVSQLASYLLENYRSDITLDSAAAALGCSKYYISRIVPEFFGTNFRTLVNNYRISAAQEMLLKAEKSVWEVAYACGFQNQSTFNRAFLKTCGMTPSEYRRSQSK